MYVDVDRIFYVNLIGIKNNFYNHSRDIQNLRAASYMLLLLYQRCLDLIASINYQLEEYIYMIGSILSHERI
jgi:hypothetical protein